MSEEIDRIERQFGRIITIFSLWFALSIAAILGSPFNLGFAEVMVACANWFLAIGFAAVAVFWRKNK